MTTTLESLAAKWEAEADKPAEGFIGAGFAAGRRSCAAELRAALAEPKVVQIAATYDHGCNGAYEPGDVLYALRSDGTMWAMYRAAASDRLQWVAIPEPPR